MNKNIVITPEVVRERLEAAFYTLDIPAEIERHTSTRLHSITRGKQYGGACPFPDCSVDTDGFMVWPVLTPRGKHYYCRGCKRSGDILKLVRDIKGLGFSDACQALVSRIRTSTTSRGRSTPSHSQNDVHQRLVNDS